MKKFILTLLLATLILLTGTLHAQEDSAVEEPEQGSPIDGTWITQSGNLLEIEVTGTNVRLVFPAYARTLSATYNNGVLVYITHYNNPSVEYCYLDVPESERGDCTGFIHADDPRHRFTLTLSENGMVLSGIKEINMMHCEWDTDENGHTYNHRPIGYEWEFYSDYQWRRTDCNFEDLPQLNGNALEKFELIRALFDRYGIESEFSLGDFDIMDRIRFEYAQCYLDCDTGEFVSSELASEHIHTEPLDGRVYVDSESGLYNFELYPYAFRTYATLLSALTMMCHQIHALEVLGDDLDGPTTQMEIDSVNYVWSHRQALCSTEDENFDHHIDFLSRALQFRFLNE